MKLMFILTAYMCLCSCVKSSVRGAVIWVILPLCSSQWVWRVHFHPRKRQVTADVQRLNTMAVGRFPLLMNK